ncbi:hypothetical protein HPB50_022531 [Hyalomma asiaticum]|uniref:Uncharacterized protein n=1 Tax=Hyalomma asiaticum TaxID=266040 RepID=A0ACB7S289_HYAAI|nr:hypothetical protein HPB50_022531 [Hyalomma asiaticum]
MNHLGLGNYNFGYDEDHTSGGSFRRETGNALGAKEGSYGLRDADGRVRVVNYVADELGFRASISTNEPGTAPSTPAGVTIGTAQQGPAAPAVPGPVAPLSAGGPSPFAFKPAPAAPLQHGAPPPLDIKSPPVGPASYGGLAPAPFRPSPLAPAGGLATAPFRASPVPLSAGLAPAPWSRTYGGPAPSPMAPGAFGPPSSAAFRTAPFAPVSYGPSLPAMSPFGAPLTAMVGAPIATRVGHHYVYRQDNFVTLPATGRPYPSQPAPHAYPAAFSSPQTGPVAHVTTSHAYGHKIVHPLSGRYHSYRGY